MNGVVEDEVIDYENMLKKRLLDVESTINKHFDLIKPAIYQ